MRIISGTHKGRRIVAPKSLPVRPTTDMAKEALFNILNNDYFFEDLNILDLFSGTGNISYEFASRGTRHIVCVDADYRCIKFIEQTSDKMKFNITTIKSDVFKYLEHTEESFDIIFADPPYNFGLHIFSKIPNIVFNRGLLKEQGVLIIEHAKQMQLSHLNNFSHQRKYGSSIFSFFKKIP